MQYEMISDKELDRLLKEEKAFLIDLRSPWEAYSGGGKYSV